MAEVAANPLTASALSRDNPYPGLRPYEEQDASWFYGRSGEINDLLKRLRRLHFVAVVGASGSGKSSLIRAGVLPQIRDGYLDAEWLIAAFRPGERPIENLAESLAPSSESGLTDFLSALHSGPMGLVRALERSGLADGARVLLLVDQFEELFQFAQRTGDSAQEEVKEFLKLLLSAASSDDVPVYVVITMRLEWLNECAAYAGLAEAINEGIYLVPQMSRRQFQQAILGPLEAAGGSITAALLDRMLNDLDARTDQLPVLQHALMRIWQHTGSAEAFDARAYESVGTFSNCLSAHAEEVFAELDERQKKVAELLFRSITQASKNRKIRRPRVASEIVQSTGVQADELATVIVAFSKPGRSFLVTTQGALQPDSIIDISHEALIRQWARLSGWVDHEAEIQSRISRLEEDAAEWDRDREGLKSCLYRSGQLTRAIELTPFIAPSSKALPFLKESLRARFWRLVWTRGSIALGVVMLVVVGAYLSYLKYDSARKSLQLAHARQMQAETEANLASLQVKKAQDFQADLIKKIDAAKGNSTALAAIAASIQAKRVYVQYAAGDLDSAKTVQVQLKRQGYAVPGTELVSADKEPRETQVRYFHAEDKSDASKVASALQAMLSGGVSVQAIANPKGVVPAGQFEVWLVPSATVTQGQAQTPAANSAPAPAPAQAQITESKPAPVIPPPSMDASICVNYKLPLQCVPLTASDKVQKGQSIILSWRTENASKVEMEGRGPVPLNSAQELTAQQSTTYKFVIEGDGGTTTKVVSFEVTSAPMAGVVRDEPMTAVKAALTRYKDAYESESIDDLSRVWPTMSKAQQKNDRFIFDQFNAIRLTLNCRDQDIHVEGDAATAACQQTAVYTQKGKKQPEQATTTTFKLRKQGDSWLVDAV